MSYTGYTVLFFTLVMMSTAFVIASVGYFGLRVFSGYYRLSAEQFRKDLFFAVWSVGFMVLLTIGVYLFGVYFGREFLY